MNNMDNIKWVIDAIDNRIKLALKTQKFETSNNGVVKSISSDKKSAIVTICGEDKECKVNPTCNVNVGDVVRVIYIQGSTNNLWIDGGSTKQVHPSSGVTNITESSRNGYINVDSKELKVYVPPFNEGFLGKNTDYISNTQVITAWNYTNTKGGFIRLNFIINSKTDTNIIISIDGVNVLSNANIYNSFNIIQIDDSNNNYVLEGIFPFKDTVSITNNAIPFNIQGMSYINN